MGSHVNRINRTPDLLNFDKSALLLSVALLFFFHHLHFGFGHSLQFSMGHSVLINGWNEADKVGMVSGLKPATRLTLFARLGSRRKEIGLAQNSLRKL